MRDYAELINDLRKMQSTEYCAIASATDFPAIRIVNDAANAIEELLRALKDCRNELCLQCGAYKQRHMGVCDGCRWLTPPKEVRDG